MFILITELYKIMAPVCYYGEVRRVLCRFVQVFCMCANYLQEKTSLETVARVNTLTVCWLCADNTPLRYWWMLLRSTLLVWKRAVSSQFMPIVGSWWPQYIINRGVNTNNRNTFLVWRRNATVRIRLKGREIHPAFYLKKTVYHANVWGNADKPWQNEEPNVAKFSL